MRTEPLNVWIINSVESLNGSKKIVPSHPSPRKPLFHASKRTSFFLSCPFPSVCLLNESLHLRSGEALPCIIRGSLAVTEGPPFGLLMLNRLRLLPGKFLDTTWTPPIGRGLAHLMRQHRDSPCFPVAVRSWALPSQCFKILFLLQNWMKINVCQCRFEL